MPGTPFDLSCDEAFGSRPKYEELIGRELAMALPPLGLPAPTVLHKNLQPSSREMPVEAGILYPAALLNSAFDAARFADELARELSTVPTDFSELRIVDRYGHARPVYRPLLVYSLTQSFDLLRKDVTLERSRRWRATLEGWRVVLVGRSEQLRWQEWPATATRGADFAEAAWIALALQSIRSACDQTDAVDWADELMHQLARSQQPGGAFLESSASDNPESVGYHELLILHAMASSAVQTRTAVLLDAVRRSARFHTAEMQPDHATNQPWALFAFLLDPATFPFADGLLNTATAQLGHHDGSRLALMLMADALYCLQRVRGP